MAKAPLVYKESRNMSYLNQVPVDQASGKLGQIYDAAKARVGGVAHIIQMMSLDADVCEASMGLYIKLMKRENALSKARKELLATVVSNINDCFY